MHTIEYCLAYRYYNNYFDYDKYQDQYLCEIMPDLDCYQNQAIEDVQELEAEHELEEEVKDKGFNLSEETLESCRRNPIYMMPHGNHVTFEEIVKSYEFAHGNTDLLPITWV